MPVAISSATAGAAAAAAKRRRDQEEEEHMTGYTTEELTGWEFKIMRSAFGAFRKQENVRQMLDEESRAGWEMVEKFDNTRIRLKRRVDKRQNDATLGSDAYRTVYGTPEYALAFVVIGLIAVGILFALFMANR